MPISRSLTERVNLTFKLLQVLENKSFQIERFEEPFSSLTQKPERVPQLVIVEQLAMKPDLKLVSKAGEKNLRQADLLSTGNPATFPEKDWKRRPVLKNVSTPRSALRSISELHPGSTKQSKMTAISAQQNGESKVRGPDLNTGLELNLANATAESSPILAFRVTGDAVIDPATGLFGRPNSRSCFQRSSSVKCALSSR